MSWNMWPRMKVEASKCVIPLIASISPIRPHPDILTLCFAEKPVPLFSTLTLASPSPPRFGSAPFVTSATIFPPHYSMISDTNLPGELYAQHTTVQYTLLGFHFHARDLHDRGGDGLCQIGFEACDVPLACCPKTPLLATFHLGLKFRFMDWASPTCSMF